MALTRQTMTDEQRKSVALEYLKAFDNGGVTSSGASILDLFASDAQVYFPKWGLATGRDQIGKLFGDVGGTLWGWGRNVYGELGDGTATDRTSPVEITQDVISVAAGMRLG